MTFLLCILFCLFCPLTGKTIVWPAFLEFGQGQLIVSIYVQRTIHLLIGLILNTPQEVWFVVGFNLKRSWLHCAHMARSNLVLKIFFWFQIFVMTLGNKCKFVLSLKNIWLRETANAKNQTADRLLEKQKPLKSKIKKWISLRISRKTKEWTSPRISRKPLNIWNGFWPPVNRRTCGLVWAFNVFGFLGVVFIISICTTALWLIWVVFFRGTIRIF